MAPRLTPKCLAALRLAVAHPKGNISSLITTATGEKSWLKASDEIALEESGFADSIDDCGHVQGTTDPKREHRSHPTSSVSLPPAARPSSTLADAGRHPGDGGVRSPTQPGRPGSCWK
jgi:hypothetical protein